jgi:tetratricopeptide (TPR) repeat protein
MTMPRKIVGSFRHRKLLLLVCASLVLISQPAAADSWYEHYFKAEQALENEDWMLAIQEINEALERKGDSGARVRSYGMNVISYFPYFKLGIAYYQLDQFDAALQAFETEARLGAIEKSADASTELERYRQLVRRAKQVAAAAEGQRIREIVADSMSRARELEEKGLLGEAMVALDQALAVAPDDVEARAAMDALRPRFAAWQRERALEQRAAKLVENGVALLDGRQFSEASSLFRQALLLTPGPEIQALLDEAQARLLAQIGTGTSTEGAPAGLDAVLDQVRALESAGRIAEALERLQATLAVAPSNADALSLQTRLLQAWQEAESERTRSMTIKRLLAEVASQFEAGLTEKSLSTANRILAIDPGNAEALSYVARAYRVISRDLLGSRPKGNIPPAVRFVDLRSENDNGMLVQTIAGPVFQLNGVIIDNSPVEVVFYREPGSVVEAEVNSQPLGEFYLTAFKVESRLAPGLTTYRLVATDAENLTSSSEYAVIYARPILRAPWFHALLLGIGLAVISALLWRRYHRLRQLRSRSLRCGGADSRRGDVLWSRRARRTNPADHPQQQPVDPWRTADWQDVDPAPAHETLARDRRSRLRVSPGLHRSSGHGRDTLLRDTRRRDISRAGPGPGRARADQGVVRRLFLSGLCPRSARHLEDAQEPNEQKGQGGVADR